jgi:hypothetical protein
MLGLYPTYPTDVTIAAPLRQPPYKPVIPGKILLLISSGNEKIHLIVSVLPEIMTFQE